MQLILLTAFLGGCANIENFDLNKSLPKFDFKNVLPELNLDQLFTYKAPKDTTAVEISINSFLNVKFL